MPVPNTMADLAQLASSNSPAGTEAIGNSLDNYLRAGFSILRSTNALSSATIAAASTTDLATSDAESVQVTGAATITSLGTGFNGCKREVRFTGVCTLVNSASLVLPPGNMATVAGDVAQFRCVGAGQWVLVGFSRPVGALGYAPVDRAGDTMTGTLTNNTAQNYVTSVRSGFSFSHFNLGNGQMGVFDSTAATNAWLYNTSTGGTHDFRGIVRASSRVQFANTIESTTALWVCGTASAGDMIFRPNGTASSSNEMILSAAGKLTPKSIQLGGVQFEVTRITVNSAAPGALPQGEIYFRY